MTVHLRQQRSHNEFCEAGLWEVIDRLKTRHLFDRCQDADLPCSRQHHPMVLDAVADLTVGGTVLCASLGSTVPIQYV